jgi:NTE family protein
MPRHHLSNTAIALQGGGAYGAWEWGVLDALFERGVRPTALSGASAGAVNAVVAAHGLLVGGPDGAREALDRLWSSMSRLHSVAGIIGAALPFVARMLAPGQFNPLGLNPLRSVLEEAVDFERLRSDRGGVPLRVSATDAATGRARIFGEREMTLDAVMASACLPTLFPAVEIDGRKYWDGGFSANPPIAEAALAAPCDTLLLLRLTPDESTVPDSPGAIAARERRMLLDAGAARELEGLERLRAALASAGGLSAEHRRLRDLDLAVLSIDRRFFADGDQSLSPTPAMVADLFGSGRAAAAPLLGGSAMAA